MDTVREVCVLPVGGDCELSASDPSDTVVPMSNTRHTQASKGARLAVRKAYVAALRDGRRQRAQTFTDRRKQRNRDACRGKVRDW